MLAVYQQPIDRHCPAPQTDARPANSSEGTRFPFGPGVELNSCYVPQRNNFLDLANKAKMARQRDPAGMEKPPGVSRTACSFQRGRPATGRDPAVTIRLPEKVLALVER